MCFGPPSISIPHPSPLRNHVSLSSAAHTLCLALPMHTDREEKENSQAFLPAEKAKPPRQNRRRQGPRREETCHARNITCFACYYCCTAFTCCMLLYFCLPHTSIRHFFAPCFLCFFPCINLFALCLSLLVYLYLLSFVLCCSGSFCMPCDRQTPGAMAWRLAGCSMVPGRRDDRDSAGRHLGEFRVGSFLLASLLSLLIHSDEMTADDGVTCSATTARTTPPLLTSLPLSAHCTLPCLHF